MAILPASLNESSKNNNNNNINANNPSGSSSRNPHHHHHYQQERHQHHQYSQSRPPASPRRKPTHYPQQQQQQQPYTRHSSISSEEDLSETSLSSSSSYDEDFSSLCSSFSYNDYYLTPTLQSPAPPRSPQRRSQYYNNNNSINNNNTAVPRTPNAASSSPSASSSSSSSSKYMHNYKKPVMPTRNLYLAMDCEMVSTTVSDSVAARVVLVDWKGRSVLDTYIQPADPVVDYKTFVSGITAEHLAHAPSFATVQQQVRDLLQDKILVGHGLENDLKALQIMDHPWWMIRDTAYYQPFMQERHVEGCGLWTPRKLRDLVHEKLHRTDFQNGAHCPAADARAALDLYKSHRPRWEACMMQHVKQTTTATATAVVATNHHHQQHVMMMSPCSVTTMMSSPMQQQQQPPMMMTMMMMPPHHPMMASSSLPMQPQPPASPMAALPFYSPSPTPRSVTPPKSLSSRHPCPAVTALPSLPF